MRRIGGVKRFGTELIATVLVGLWSRFGPPTTLRSTLSIAPSDRVQRAMNLIMPLHVPNIAARGKLASLLFQSTDELLAGLANVGTIHFARFDIVDGNLCMFSIYDGDFRDYIRDFIATIGGVFDAILEHVKDPPPLPCTHHVDEFIDWIAAHDAFQLPLWPTDVVSRDLGTLPRDSLLALHRNPNIQLAIYRHYPGFSAAQIRHGLSIGW